MRLQQRIASIILFFACCTSISAHTSSYNHAHTDIQWLLIIVTLIASAYIAVKK